MTPTPLRADRLRMVDHPAAAAEQATRVPRVDDRRVLNNIYWRLRTGSAWADIPERYGLPPTTSANRIRAGPRLAHGTASRNSVEGLRRRPSDDRCLIGPAASAWGQCQKGDRTPRRPRLGTTLEPNACGVREATGQPRSMLLVDTDGMPIILKLTEGQAHDHRSAADMLDSVPDGQILLANRTYGSDGLRETMIARGAWANRRPTSRRRDPPPATPFGIGPRMDRRVASGTSKQGN